MTAPPKKRTVLTCESKKRWPDEHSARAGAMVSIELNGNATELWVYNCPECRGWHLTKRNNGILLKVTLENPVHGREVA
jgi:hypothetical protein